MGRAHKQEATFARAASHLGYVRKEMFFEAMKAILAAQRDHGNREVRASARRQLPLPLALRPRLLVRAAALPLTLPSSSAARAGALVGAPQVPRPHARH